MTTKRGKMSFTRRKKDSIKKKDVYKKKKSLSDIKYKERKCLSLKEYNK